MFLIKSKIYPNFFIKQKHCKLFLNLFQDITRCDGYLEIMSLSKCNAQFLVDSFEFCSDFYLNQYDKNHYEFTNAIQCADMELRAGFSQITKGKWRGF